VAFHSVAISFDDANTITVSDTVPDPNAGQAGFAALYVGAAGNVKVRTAGGNDVTFIAVPAGTFLYIRTIRVWSTGTTVTTPNTNILGMISQP
jgi:hypothetical protein